MNHRIFFENFELLTDAPNGVQKLREMILLLAVQGKLVPQDSRDESAAILLEKIRSEKERLVKEGKIRKSKPLPSISIDEIYFELPYGWQWIRFDDICSYTQRGKGPKYVEKSDIPVISQKCIQWDGFKLDRAKFISPSSLEKYNEERFLHTGDLLWNSTGTGTIGRVNVYVHEDNSYDKVVADSHVTVVRPILLNSRFIYYWIASPMIQNEIEEMASGTTNQIELNLSAIKNHLFPLPPLQEQKRIVVKVKQLMALCDELEARQQKKHEQRIRLNNAALDKLLTAPTSEEFAQYWQRICDNFDLLYDAPETVGQLRQAILQLAVQGKLVAQDEGDESAAVLLEEIRNEKEGLIKEKKIKKLKSYPSIGPEEIPYHKPENWKWIRLRDLGEICGGGTPSKNKIEYWDGEINWFSPKDMKNKHVNKSELKISDKALKETRLRMIPVNSILMVARSGILKRYFPVCINDVECTVNQDIKVLIPFIPGITQYLQLMLKGHQQFILENLVKGGMTVQSLKYAEFEQQPFPLPPKKELQRIVAKVDHLMALCNELEAGLVQAQTEGGKLMEAVVHHVLAA